MYCHVLLWLCTTGTSTSTGLNCQLAGLHSAHASLNCHHRLGFARLAVISIDSVLLLVFVLIPVLFLLLLLLVLVLLLLLVLVLVVVVVLLLVVVVAAAAAVVVVVVVAVVAIGLPSVCHRCAPLLISDSCLSGFFHCTLLHA